MKNRELDCGENGDVLVVYPLGEVDACIQFTAMVRSYKAR